MIWPKLQSEKWRALHDIKATLRQMLLWKTTIIPWLTMWAKLKSAGLNSIEERSSITYHIIMCCFLEFPWASFFENTKLIRFDMFQHNQICFWKLCQLFIYIWIKSAHDNTNTDIFFRELSGNRRSSLQRSELVSSICCCFLCCSYWTPLFWFCSSCCLLWRQLYDNRVPQNRSWYVKKLGHIIGR